MGKNLKQQRRGKGNTRYRSPSHRFVGDIKYIVDLGKTASGKIIDFFHGAGKKFPVAVIDFNGQRELMIPAEGAFVGQEISYGGDANNCNVLELGNIPEGTKIYNIELRPGDGGKICRSPGSFALVATKTGDECDVVLPSRRQVKLNLRCRATIGVPAGAGRYDKPFMKAGNKYHAMHAIGKLYPRVRGVAMNPVDHPFGGKTKPGKHKTISRNASPGRKVGSISPKRTGKRKR